MNFAKFLRTPFLTEHLQWLFLKNQANLDAGQVGLKDPVPLVNLETPQPKPVIHKKNKPEEEINALKLETQL